MNRIQKYRDDYRFRNGLFRLIPPKPNTFGLALPGTVGALGIEKLGQLGGYSNRFLHVTIFHVLADQKQRTTLFRFYIRVFRKTWKLEMPGHIYALKGAV